MSPLDKPTRISDASELDAVLDQRTGKPAPAEPDDRPPVTAAALEKHARRFGIDCIWLQADMAIDDPLALVRFKVVLKDIATEHRRARKPKTWWENPPKVGKEDALFLYSAGYTIEEAAEAIGERVATVKKWVFEAPEQAAQTAAGTGKAGYRG
jgi:Putative ATPase subunit of terminase (gpP-like)